MIPQRLLDEINRWIEGKRYGEISIKFNAGHIVHMTRTESLKVVLENNSTITNATASIIRQPDQF